MTPRRRSSWKAPALRAALLVSAPLILAPALAGVARQISPDDPAVLEAFFDGLIQGQLRERNIAGATLAVVRGGDVLFTKGYGYADVDLRRPVDPDETLLRIASVTKLFTYTAVMQLVEEGRLDLAADVNEYLDFRIPDTYAEPITLTHLMTHTAGFEEDLRNLFTFDPQRIRPLEACVKANRPHPVRPPARRRVQGRWLHDPLADPRGLESGR